ncbi:Ca2+ regulator and membrane fusion protein Fig1-domain-containing protein [Lipomyces japonicus]|uniref:Ca2+ regulator and membrane fusion protein Fig1-domain-containing protein n=1 Tax=Lipomyces japonicus TaxID=56871 RepID=UPI0034CF5139
MAAVKLKIMALLLAGCSSSSGIMPNIYLLNIGYNDGIVYATSSSSIVNSNLPQVLGNFVGKTNFEVRIGYFALCTHVPPESWLCSPNATTLAERLAAVEDPLNILNVAETFRQKIVFPYLLVTSAGLAFVVFLLTMPYPPLLKTVSIGLCFVSVVLVLISVLWQHTASVAASTVVTNLGEGTLFTGVGLTSMVLGWMSFGLLTVSLMGIYLFVRINSVISHNVG